MREMKMSSEERAPGPPGRDHPRMKQEPDTPGKIMVSGIPIREDYTPADLERQFAPFGRITEVNIIKDRRTELPRGFAFITYENPQDAEDATKAMEGKDIGGESAVHCEQAVIGLRRSIRMREETMGGRGGRGMDRGVRGRGMDRGRGRGMMERGRGMMERGRGGMDRGRGLMDRGGRGMRGGRGGMGDRMGRGWHDEQYFEEPFEPEPGYGGFPPRGRGRPAPRRGPPGRGAPPGRGMLSAPGRGAPNRRVLLPDPPMSAARGGPAGGPGRRPPPPEDYYGEDANGYTGEDYSSGGYEDPYAAEGYEDPYAEEEYPPEDYYARERPIAPQARGAAMATRTRGAAMTRGRGLATRGRPEMGGPSAGPRQQSLDEYGYPLEESSAPPQRVARPSAQVPRRSAAAYADEMYEEEQAVDPYSRGRFRVPPSTPQSVMARPVRGARGAASATRGTAPATRGTAPATRGTAPARRAALLGGDPYSEDAGLYDRPTPAKVAASSAYEDDPYADPYSRKAAAASRTLLTSRGRVPPSASEDMYATERSPPKSQMLAADPSLQRRGAMSAAASSRYADDYQSSDAYSMSSREAYPETRRPIGRRSDPEYRVRDDPYQSMSTAAEAYVSYPSSRSQGESLASDPYSRKRPLDPYDDPAEVSRPVRADYDDYRSAPSAVPAKRERMERGGGGDRGVYEAYSSRQEGVYRGL